MDIKLVGFDELAIQLKNLPDDFMQKVGWKATIEGAKIVRDKAIANVPVAAKPHWFYPYKGTRRGGTKRKNRERQSPGTATRVEITPGLVRRAIQVRRMRQREWGVMRYMIGPMKSRFLPGYANDPFYWTWLEYGKSGYAPRRFLRNAFDSSTEQVIDKMRTMLAEYIGKANKKLVKNYLKNAA